MTGNDVMWPEVTGSDLEVTSFDRKSPGSGCKRRISQVFGTFENLQGCNSQEVAATLQEMASCGRKLPKVTWKGRHLIGSHLEEGVRRLCRHNFENNR